jgi:hypothetical protein
MVCARQLCKAGAIAKAHQKGAGPRKGSCQNAGGTDLTPGGSFSRNKGGNFSLSSRNGQNLAAPGETFHIWNNFAGLRSASVDNDKFDGVRHDAEGMFQI